MSTGKLHLVSLLALVIGPLLAPITVAASAEACVLPPSGMLGWWPGDGNSEDIAGDNDGALEGGATFATGMVGQAFTLDGVDDYIQIADDGQGSDLDGLSQLTVDAWINPNAEQWIDPTTGESIGMIVGKYDSTQATGVSYDFTLKNGKLRLAVFQSVTPISVAGLQSDSDIEAGIWSHVAGVWKGGAEFELYVNGAQISGTPLAEGPTPSAMANNSVPVNIGRAESFSGSFVGPAAYFGGLIDEVEIFDRALSASEIEAIFNAGSAGKCKITQVEIDIRPGSDSNKVNPNSPGAISVAILTTDTFDASAADAATVRFGHTGTEAAPVRSALRDVDADGDVDLLLRFQIPDTGIVCGDTSASLSGTTSSGQMIEGADSIITPSCD